jgi:hypothetical protein
MAGTMTRLHPSVLAFADLLPLAALAGPVIGKPKSGPAAGRPGF